MSNQISSARSPFLRFVGGKLVEWFLRERRVSAGKRYAYRYNKKSDAIHFREGLLTRGDPKTYRVGNIELMGIKPMDADAYLVPVIAHQGATARTALNLSILTMLLSCVISLLEGRLADACLLIFHDSDLDTVSNSVEDLASPGGPLTTEMVLKDLEWLVAEKNKEQPLQNREIYTELINHVARYCDAEDEDFFELVHLYTAIEAGGLSAWPWHKLRLLDDTKFLEERPTKDVLASRFKENNETYRNLKRDIEDDHDEVDQSQCQKATERHSFQGKCFDDSDSAKEQSDFISVGFDEIQNAILAQKKSSKLTLKRIKWSRNATTGRSVTGSKGRVRDGRKLNGSSSYQNKHPYLVSAQRPN